MCIRSLCFWPVILATVPRVGLVDTVTYQGSLQQAGEAVDGPCDLLVVLWNAETNGSAVGLPVALFDLPVTDGVFTPRPRSYHAAGNEGLGTSRRTLSSPSRELMMATPTLAAARLS